jgi:hypothetical protein
MTRIVSEALLGDVLDHVQDWARDVARNLTPWSSTLSGIATCHPHSCELRSPAAGATRAVGRHHRED